jgi:hypothetical protein
MFWTSLTEKKTASQPSSGWEQSLQHLFLNLYLEFTICCRSGFWHVTSWLSQLELLISDFQLNQLVMCSMVCRYSGIGLLQRLPSILKAQQLWDCKLWVRMGWGRQIRIFFLAVTVFIEYKVKSILLLSPDHRKWELLPKNPVAAHCSSTVSTLWSWSEII